MDANVKQTGVLQIPLLWIRHFGMDSELDSDPAPDPAFFGHVADKMLPGNINFLFQNCLLLFKGTFTSVFVDKKS
jgi:hypothetical protein